MNALIVPTFPDHEVPKGIFSALDRDRLGQLPTGPDYGPGWTSRRRKLVWASPGVLEQQRRAVPDRPGG